MALNLALGHLDTHKREVLEAWQARQRGGEPGVPQRWGRGGEEGAEG